jgi:hypothetical protein
MNGRDKMERWYNPNPQCNNCDGAGANLDHRRPEEDGPGPCGVCWEYAEQFRDHEPRVASRIELLDMVIGFEAALEVREKCLNCGGDGKVATWIGGDPDEGGSVDWEPCTCSSDAIEILDHYSCMMSHVINEYLWLHGYDPEKIKAEFDSFAAGLLEQALERERAYRFGPDKAGNVGGKAGIRGDDDH